MAIQVEFTNGYDSPLKEKYAGEGATVAPKVERSYQDAADKNVAKTIVYQNEGKLYLDAEHENEIPAEEYENLFLKGVVAKTETGYVLGIAYDETNGIVFATAG